MSDSTSILDLDTTRHEMVFEPRNFNPRRVAIIGRPEEIVWLFTLLCRLGVQNYAIYCNDPVEHLINTARRAVEKPGRPLFDVQYYPGKILSVLNGPRASVLFIAHEHPQRRALCAEQLSNALGAREAVFVPALYPNKLKIVSAEVMEVAQLDNLPTSIHDPEVESPIYGRRLFVAAQLAYAFLSWWAQKGGSAAAEHHLGAHLPQRISNIASLVSPRALTASELSMPVDVIGLGAIGSWTVIGLLLEGFTNVRGYDADTVSGHNIPNQAYYRVDEGKNKALALANVVSSLGLRGYYPQPRMVQLDKDPLSSRVVLVTDNFEERSKLFQRTDETRPRIVISAGMGVNSGSVRTSDLSDSQDAALYARTLLDIHASNLKSAVRACRIPTLSPVGVALAALAVGQVVQSIIYEPRPGEQARSLHLSNGVLSDADDGWED